MKPTAKHRPCFVSLTNQAPPFSNLRTDQELLSKTLSERIDSLKEAYINDIDRLTGVICHVTVPTPENTDLYIKATSLLSQADIPGYVYSINSCITNLKQNIELHSSHFHIIIETQCTSETMMLWQDSNGKSFLPEKKKLKELSNVVWIYASEIPYGLYTRNSKFSVSKELYLKEAPKAYRGVQYHVNSMHDCFPTIISDSQFEQSAEALCEKCGEDDETPYWQLPDLVLRETVLVEHGLRGAYYSL